MRFGQYMPKDRNITLLLNEYKAKKKAIEKALAGFRELWLKGSEEDIFSELCFCLLTPQSKALSCAVAIEKLKENKLLVNGKQAGVASCLRTLTRFHNNKASYIRNAGKIFSKNNKIIIKEKIAGFEDKRELRDWLVDNIKGLGLKEASHFLRNIGFGRNVAILDRHILKNLEKLGVIKKIPDTLSRKIYIEIEQKMKEFSDRSGIPLEALDLLFWSRQTGRIFK